MVLIINIRFSISLCTPWTRDYPGVMLLLTEERTTQKGGENIQAVSGIRTHKPSVRAINTQAFYSFLLWFTDSVEEKGNI